MDSVDEVEELFHQHNGFYGDEVDGKRLGDHTNFGEHPTPVDG